MNQSKITPILKDKILEYICQADFERNIYIELKTILSELNIEFNDLQAILSQFERLGFISNLNLRRNVTTFFLIVHVDALDFKNRGGFLVYEYELKMKLEKMALEIDSLSKSFPEKASVFTNIAADIASCLSLVTMLKKISLILLVSFSFYNSFSQERIDSKQPSINKNLVFTLNQATGYLKNETGKWISKQNRIPFRLEPQFEKLSNSEVYSLGENNENFIKYEFRKININDTIYNVFIRYYKSGFYEYKSIKKGWNYTKSLDFYVFDNSELEKLNLFTKDSLNNLKIKPIYYSTLEYLDEYKLSYIENKIQELKSKKKNLSTYEKLVERKYKKETYLYFNFLYFKDVVRFKIDIFDFDLKDEYYETSKVNFESFYVDFLNTEK
uniref:hypothetical protein n=2 Tax=Flavobacterium sp. TaxID=239 RepID=UPI0040481AD8